MTALDHLLSIAIYNFKSPHLAERVGIMTVQLCWNKCNLQKSVTNICTHVLLLLDSVSANNVSLYKLCGSLMYLKG